MQVAKDTVVTLRFRVTDPNGNLIDDGKEPLVYLHGGYDGIFSRIEEELHGREEGEELEVKLQPEEAFGEYDADLVHVEEASLFPEGIEVGMQFERATDDGEDEMIYTITEIEGDRVVVDGNHPLAGTALIFTCAIAEVRVATAEELTHGHVHGQGGHTH